MADSAYPIIAWDNKAETGATISASTEATGYPVENCQDWRPFTRWKSTYTKDSNISETTEDGQENFGTVAQTEVGQTFTVAARSRVDKVTVKLTKQGAPTDNVECEIWSTSGTPALPDTLLYTSPTTVAGASIGAAAEFEFQFDDDLAAGVYAIVLDRSGADDNVDYFQARNNSASVYADGYQVHNAGGWVQDAAEELYFKVDYDYPDQWILVDLGSAAAVTSVAITGHNMNTVGVTNLVLQWSTDAISFTNAHTAFTPANDKTQFKTFTSASKRYWRLFMPTGYTAAIELGVFFFGEYMEFPRLPQNGFDPDAQAIKVQNALNQNGHLLGAIEKYSQRDISARFTLLTNTWVVNTYIPFWQSHRSKPFYWAWDITNYATAVYFVRLSSPKLAVPFNHIWRSLTLEMKGVAEE
jgi:hypothetical protein